MINKMKKLSCSGGLNIFKTSKILLPGILVSCLASSFAMEAEFETEKHTQRGLTPSAQTPDIQYSKRSTEELWTEIFDPLGAELLKAYTLKDLMNEIALINKASYRKVTGHEPSDTDLSVPSEEGCLLKQYSAHYRDIHTYNGNGLSINHRRGDLAPLLNRWSVVVNQITFRPFGSEGSPIPPCWLWSILDQNLTRPHESWWPFIKGTNVIFVNSSFMQAALWADNPGYQIDDEKVRELAEHLKKSISVKRVSLNQQPLSEDSKEKLRTEYPQITWMLDK